MTSLIEFAIILYVTTNIFSRHQHFWYVYYDVTTTLLWRHYHSTMASLPLYYDVTTPLLWRHYPSTMMSLLIFSHVVSISGTQHGLIMEFPSLPPLLLSFFGAVLQVSDSFSLLLPYSSVIIIIFLRVLVTFSPSSSPPSPPSLSLSPPPPSSAIIFLRVCVGLVMS